VSPSQSRQTFAGRAGFALLLVVAIVVGGFIFLNVLLTA
jgi:hypothetical protein